jgi:hypothetical protein
MSGNDTILALHDRATRGEMLSREEQALLDQWYLSEDNAEQGVLDSSAADGATEDVQVQITAVLERCIMLAQKNQELFQQNDELRRELTQLRQQVARHLQAA